MKDNEFVKEAKRMMAAEKARNMRYKKSMLASLGWAEIESELNDIEEECSGVHWLTADDDALVAALDGNEDEAYEFKMVFADIEGKCEILRRTVEEITYYDDYFEDVFNACTVALIGNRYEVIGFDTFEEDYYSMCKYEQNLAITEAGKRIMRMTKSEMISTIGQCFGIVLAFADLRQQYDSISAAMAILRQENKSIIDTVKMIEAAYDRCKDNWGDRDDEFDRLLENLPERAWLE